MVRSAEVQTDLEFFQFEVLKGQKIARMTAEDEIHAEGMWDKDILCCILGSNPPVDVIKGFVSRIWREYVIEDVYFHKEGQYIVCFQRIEERDEIVKRKYYYFDNKPMLVQKWVPGGSVNLMELRDIPIWVQFPNLDMKYWSLSSLGKLGSLLGKPIKRDKATATRARWNYARIQVEVQAQQDFPKML